MKPYHISCSVTGYGNETGTYHRMWLCFGQISLQMKKTRWNLKTKLPPCVLPEQTAGKSYPAIVVLNLLSGHQCGQKLVIILTQPLSLHLLFMRNGDHKPCNNLGPWTTASQDMGCSAWFRSWNTNELLFNPAFLAHPHINSIGLHTIPVSYVYMGILYRYPYCTNWVCSPIFDGHHKYGYHIDMFNLLA